MNVFVNKSNLKKLRKQNSLSQCRLSQLAGLPNNAVFRMETENRKVSVLRITAIANVLKCDISQLTNMEG